MANKQVGHDGMPSINSNNRNNITAVVPEETDLPVVDVNESTNFTPAAHDVIPANDIDASDALNLERARIASMRSTPGAFPTNNINGNDDETEHEDNARERHASMGDVDEENGVDIDEELDRLGVHRVVDAEAVPVDAEAVPVHIDNDNTDAPSTNANDDAPSSDNQEIIANAEPIKTIKCCFGKDIQALNIKWLLVVAFVVIVAIVVPVTITNVSPQDEQDPTNPEPETPQVLPPVLETLQERGVLRCGIYDRLGFSAINNETKEREGFEIDLCKAVAAASLGSSYRYETILTTGANRFVKLARGDFDVLISGTTHTFDRDVHQLSAGMGFSFSTPYLYGGMTFNGVPEFVKCADKLSVVGNCANLLICSILGTTWLDMTEELFPMSNIVLTEDQTQSIQNLIEGKCNVIQGEQYEAPEVVVRYLGYEGPYAQGNNSFTKEPLAAVTRDGDPEFADFVNWVVQGLLRAEEDNITMQTAETFTKTGSYEDQFENMFQNALSAVGNYGEIYSRNLEPISPRLKVNTINNGETGLMYSHPLGQINTVGPGPIKGGIIESILQRGFLRCGIPLRNNQSVLEDMQETSSDKRVELDIEFCRALSASILQRAPDNISFESFSSEYENISLALENGDIDVYAGGQVDMNSDVRRPGLSFSKPYFYEAPSGNSTAGKAVSLVTKQGDAQWADLVYWVTMATTYAEENGIVQATSNEMPLVSLFGADLERVLRDTILAVGNYDEMYGRVFGQNASRVGRNMLNASPFGPEHYPLPFGKDLTDES